MLSFVDIVPALLLYCGDHNRCDGGHGVDYGLTGTVAIVGGSSSGMGEATARALAAEGCRVVLYARRGELLEEVARRIAAETGTETLAAPADATDHAALDLVVERALERFGRLDILVNNAGGPPACGYESFSDADWQAAYELTLLSALRITRRALPALRESGRGRIVNLTSSAVKETNDGLLLSNTFRPGVIGWAKAISRDEARHGITVNSIAPGYIATERLVQLYSSEDDPDAAMKCDAETIPAGRFGDPDEIAAAVAFLCSTGAAYINGTTLLVDGGLARGLLS
jgi:3-oxoacyl-[acyl-carrier protein] reductase